MKDLADLEGREHKVSCLLCVVIELQAEVCHSAMDSEDCWAIVQIGFVSGMAGAEGQLGISEMTQDKVVGGLKC